MKHLLIIFLILFSIGLSAQTSDSTATHYITNGKIYNLIGNNITKVGTPVNNQIVVWTGDGTLEGDANFTWDTANLDVTGNIVVSGTVDGIDIATWLDQDVSSGSTPTLTATNITGIVTAGIVDDEILEADLDVTNAPTDNYYLTFDSASGGFTWDLGGAYTPEDTAYASNWDGDTDATTKNTIWDAFFVQSDITGITGSTQITNMMSITQAGYDAITPDASTLYVINNASPATVGTSATIAMDGWIMYNDQTADAATITLSDCDPGEQLTVYINRASAPTLAGTGLTFNPLPNTTAFAAATQMGIFFEVSYDGTTIDYYYFER